jgi:hypothetical protein
LNPLDFFLWDCKGSRVREGGAQEGRRQLAEATNVAPFGIKKGIGTHAAAIVNGTTIGSMHTV